MNLCQEYVLLDVLARADAASNTGETNPLYQVKHSRACMEAIAQGTDSRHFRRNQQIIRRNESINGKSCVYIIDHGEVRIKEIRPDGWTRSYILRDGAVFGERAIVHPDKTSHRQRKRFIEAVAMQDTLCMRINQDTFHYLARSFDDLIQQEKLTSLRLCGLFPKLDEAELEVLSRWTKTQSFPKDAEVIQQHEVTGSDSMMYIILDGADQWPSLPSHVKNCAVHSLAGAGTCEVLKFVDGKPVYFSNEAGGHLGERFVV
eukprot:SAG25_NODE_1353_length_3223_cov_1.533611_2_plen_260_part_00